MMILQGVRRQKPYTGVCNVDLYFRLHKLHYSVTYTFVSTAPFFAKTPLLFGMWHAYKYCVTECYRRFLPLSAALVYEQFLTDPAKVEILTNFNLFMMESMVLSVFLCTNRVVPLIRSAIAQLWRLRDVYGAGAVKLQQLKGMLALFRDYAPALWYLGYCVRTLHWRRHDPWSGKEARDILQFRTLMLLAPKPRQGRRQYMDALLLATLQWHPYIDCLPGAAFREEKLEATLTELQRAQEDNPTIVTVKDHQKNYRYLNRKPNLPRDIVDPHLPRSFPCRVFIRVKRILAAIENGTLPFMPLAPRVCLQLSGHRTLPSQHVCGTCLLLLL